MDIQSSVLPYKVGWSVRMLLAKMYIDKGSVVVPKISDVVRTAKDTLWEYVNTHIGFAKQATRNR